MSVLSTRIRISSLGRSAVAAGVSVALVLAGTTGAAGAGADSTARDRLLAAGEDFLGAVGDPGVLRTAADPQLLVQQWLDDPDSDAVVVPNLIGTGMLIMSDDPATPEDEQALALVVAGASGPTVDTHRVALTLDTNGDLEDDIVMGSPTDAPLVEGEEYAGTALARQGDGSFADTGAEVLWMRLPDGYLALFDWRELGLTSVRTAFHLDDGTGEPGHADSVPDAYTGDLVVLPVQPSQPLSPRATFGNSSATVRWLPPASAGTAPIRGYKVSASPGQAYCTATTTSCVVKGLANGMSYTFTVVAKSAHGISAPSAPSNAVTPRARAIVRLGAVDSGNKLFVNVDPNQGSGYYTFRVQRRVSGAWRTLPTYYRTAGDGETRTLDLGRGTYRVVVLAKYGFFTAYSSSAYLSR